MRLEEIPKEVLNEFAYQGRLTFVDWFLNDAHWINDDNKIWTKEYIETLRKDFRNGMLLGTYGKDVVHRLSAQLDEYLPNCVIIVQYTSVVNYILEIIYLYLFSQLATHTNIFSGKLRECIGNRFPGTLD